MLSDKLKKIPVRRYFALVISVVFLLAVLIAGFLYMNGPDRWKVISAIPGPIRKAGKMVLREINNAPYILYRFGSSELPQYSLKIKPVDLNFLNNNLPEIGEEMTDDYQVYVPAKFFFNDEEYDVDVRYRGATSAHWAYPKKSLRIRFKGDHLLNGMKTINLILPEDRGMIAEELNSYRARKLGLIVPDSQFVTISINGDTPAVYWEVEQTTKEFLEKNELSGDTNMYSEIYLYKDIFTDINYWKKYSVNPSRSENDFTELAVLLDILNNPNDEEFDKTIFNILDEDSFYNWTIWYLLAGSSAQGSQHNVRLYFDPSIGKFKFVAWDLSISEWYYYPDKYGAVDPRLVEESDSPLAIRILRQPEFMAERNERLWQYVQNENNLADELKYNDDTYQKIRKAFYQDTIKEYTNKYFDESVKSIRQIVENNFTGLRDLFVNDEVSCEFSFAGDESVSVNLFTASLAPLKVGKVELLDKNKNVAQTVYPEMSVISPVVANETLSTDYFIASGGIYIQYFDIFALAENSAKFDVSVGDGVKVYVENLYTGGESGTDCVLNNEL